MKYDYLIVGAGLFGATFAREALDRGKRVLVVDRRDHIAGNCYTETVNGIEVHRYGAHIFHTSDRRVWDFVNRFAEFNGYINSPVAVWHDELYNLPFNMNTFHALWGVKTPAEARKIVGEQIASLPFREAHNLEEQALLLAGRDVYEKLVKEYTEKQWGKKCTELPPFIIRRLPLRFTYDNNYFDDRYQGIPVGGYTRLVERMLAGADVKTGVDYADAKGLAERTVYTGMIDEYFGYRLGALAWRSLRFETKVLADTDNFQGNAVVNYTSHDVAYTRIIEHRHFDKTDARGTVITYEYPDAWQRGKEPYYPVNDAANEALLAEYEKLAKEERGVVFGGRLGSYKYYDMHRVIAEALALAERELQ